MSGRAIPGDGTVPEGTTRRRAVGLLQAGTRLLEQGKPQQAIPLLQQALELVPGDVAALLNLGGAYVMAGQHRLAIPLLESARDTEPGNPMVWINLGAAYLGNPVLATREQQMQAITAFERALQLNPAAPSVHYNLGLIFVDRGDRDLASAAFRRAVQVNPYDRDARQWLARLDSETAQRKESQE